MARLKRKNGVEGAVICESVEQLADVIYCLKAEGKVVVLTNGAFDLLHVGHTRCLKDAKSRGDYLIVAVNSDSSIKKYKHPKLPIQPLQDRMELVAAIRWVDYVVPFDEETADAVIEAVKPDIVAKGTDYTPETVPERETIAAQGATIAICGDEKKRASSKLIQRIRRLKM